MEDTYPQGHLPIATSVKSLNVFSKNKLIHYFSRIFPSQIFLFRSSSLEVFLRKGVLKICSKFAEEHTCRRHGYSPVNCCIFLEHIFIRAYWSAASAFYWKSHFDCLYFRCSLLTSKDTFIKKKLRKSSLINECVVKCRRSAERTMSWTM